MYTHSTGLAQGEVRTHVHSAGVAQARTYVVQSPTCTASTDRLMAGLPRWRLEVGIPHGECFLALQPSLCRNAAQAAGSCSRSQQGPTDTHLPQCISYSGNTNMIIYR